MTTLLLHPPAVKPAEPPLGPAILLAALRRRGLDARHIDANLQAYLYLLKPQRLAAAAESVPSTAVKRALRHAPAALSLLRSPAAFDSFPRYRTAVEHLNRALGLYGEGAERLTLGDYSHGALSEFAPADLERVTSGEEATLFHDYFVDELLPQVEELKPRTVSLSVNYRHQILPAFELAGLLRRRLPDLRIVGGGGMFTSWRRTLREEGRRFSGFDHIVFGPGEDLLPRIVSGEGVPDYFLEGGKQIDFRPDFGSADLGDYFSPLPVLPVGASRGCYWQRCLFCPEAATPTHPYAVHPAGDLPDLLLDLRRRYQATRFHLTDNAIPTAALRTLAARRDELTGISWHGFVRFEPALLEPGLIEGLAAAGCRMLQLGLESGSQAVLDRLGKGTRLEEASAILERLHGAGIASYVYVMLGMPGETEQDAERTLEFLEEHAPRISFLNIAIMNLPRESALAGGQEATVRSSALLDSDQPLGLYRSFEPAGGWGRGEARRFLRRRLLASPAVREIVNRVPPWFTSNHAPFFTPST